MRLVRGHAEEDVQLEGLLVRIDRPGAPPMILRAASADEARAAYLRAIDARLAEGYVEGTDPVTDLPARLVHADELQLRGDPLGELIAVQAELAALPAAADPRHRRRLEHRAAAILDEQHDAWFGSLARLVRKPSRKAPPVPVLEVSWRLGFAEDVRLRGAEQLPIHEVYARLRELPLSRQILRLVAGTPDAGLGPADRIYPHTIGPSYEPLLDAMLEHGIPSRLSELVLGDVQVHQRPVLRLGHVPAVVEAAPALEALRIVGGHGDLALASERLRLLELGDVTLDDLHRLADAQLPGLEALILRARARDRMSAPAVFEVFPALCRLTLDGFSRAVGAVATTLVAYLAAAMPASLRVLALPRCALDDRDLAVIDEHPELFQRLTRLDLRYNRFSAALAAAVKRKVPALRVDSLRERRAREL
ncbi:MAG TPA: hypothetical protein VNO30_34135 [Kofleriaceae bacterium]|nr:hypothetical protein [Kofleriaceae bacterium]